MSTSPERYGRYELLFPLGRGGMAEVFAARLRGEGGFEKLFALKRMHRHLADDETFVRMFLDEGRLAASIASPYVVPTHDLGRGEDGELFLVMDLVVGVSLSVIVRAAGKLAPAIAVEILAQAATGLHDAHQATALDGSPLGIVHRDVSPHNIIIGVDGRARIADFGVAHALQRVSSTAAGQLKGKYAYFSPEQARAREIDARSDVFALGIVAWEVLTGRRLFDADHPVDVIQQVVAEDAPNVASLAPEVPAPLCAVVARALRKDRRERFASAAEMARALRDAAAGTFSLADGGEIGRFVREQATEEIAGLLERLRGPTGVARGSGSGASRSASEPEPSPSDEASNAAGPPLSRPTRRVALAPTAHPLAPDVAPVPSDARAIARDETSVGWEPTGAARSRPRRALAGAVAAAVALIAVFGWWLSARPPEDRAPVSTAPARSGDDLSAASAPDPPLAATPAERAAERVAPAPASVSHAATTAALAAPRSRALAIAASTSARPLAAPSAPPPPSASAAAPPASHGPLIGVDAFDRHAHH